MSTGGGEVSRETHSIPVARNSPLPPVPAAAGKVFGDRIGLAEAFATLLATVGVERGLIGPREGSRLWERHLLNCALLGEAIPGDVDVCDIGSGAGLPGLVLALDRPDLRVTVVEPLLRRTTFLDEVVRELALPNVTVLRARAEDLHGTHRFQVVTSRAVAPLGRLLDWSMPLVRTGGTMLAMKGGSVEVEIEASQRQFRQHRAEVVDVLRLGQRVIDPPATVLRVEAVGRPG